MKKYSLEIDGKKYEVEVDLSGPNPNVLVNGKISLEGQGKDLLNNPDVQAAYLEGGK